MDEKMRAAPDVAGLVGYQAELKEKINAVSRRSLDGSVVMSSEEWNGIVELVEKLLTAAHRKQGAPVAGLLGEVCGGDASHNTVNVVLDNPAPWSQLPIGSKVSVQPQPAEQQPEPGVAGLVEALEQCVTSMIDSGYRADAVVIQAARAALATYRKQGGEA